ncbi:unnamed protein product [Prunus armeniaca]
MQGHGEHLAHQRIIAFVEYHDTPKMLEGVLGSKSPLNGVKVGVENLLGRVACSISSVNRRPLNLLRPLGLGVDHSRVSRCLPLAMFVAFAANVYNVGIAGQPPHRLTGLAKGFTQHVAWNMLFLFEHVSAFLHVPYVEGCTVGLPVGLISNGCFCASPIGCRHQIVPLISSAH